MRKERRRWEDEFPGSLFPRIHELLGYKRWKRDGNRTGLKLRRRRRNFLHQVIHKIQIYLLLSFNLWVQCMCVYFCCCCWGIVRGLWILASILTPFFLFTSFGKDIPDRQVLALCVLCVWKETLIEEAVGDGFRRRIRCAERTGRLTADFFPLRLVSGYVLPYCIIISSQQQVQRKNYNC